MSSPITIGSLFSGIGGFDLAFKNAGAETIWFCEKDKNCQQVLRRHWPGVHIYEDVQKMSDFATPDVLVGGFPCQDLSVAGLRKGLDGERSGLWFEFLRIIADHKPRWVVIENVPGLLSSNKGQDIQIVIDGLAQIGYTVDVDIKDAQEFGVAQRRRRVFLVCVRLSDSLKRKTNLSRQISADLAVQQLADIWGAIPQAWSAVQLRLDLGSQTERSVNLLRKRMALLNVAREDLASEKYPSGLDALLAQFTDGDLSLESFSTERNALREQSLRVMAICKSLLKKMEGDDGHLNMSILLNSALEDVLKQASKSTTLTFSPGTTETIIFTFSLAMLHTVALIAPCLGWSSSCWSVASSVLTLLKESTNYARQASRSLFIPDRVRDGWRDYLSTASSFQAVFEQCLGAVRASEILFEREGSSWDSPPRRETGQDIAGTLSARTSAGGGLGTDFECNGGLQAFGLTGNSHYAERPATLRAEGGDCGGGSEHLIAGTVSSKWAKGTGGPSGDECQNLVVTPTLRSNGDAHSGFTTGDGLVIAAPDVVGTLDSGGSGAKGAHGGAWPGTTVQSASAGHCFPVAFAQNTRDELRYINGDGQIAGALAAEAGMKQQSYVLYQDSEFGVKAYDSAGTLRAGRIPEHQMVISSREVAQAFQINASDEVRTSDIAYTLNTNGNATGRNSPTIAGQFGVRRLTPTECEALQGFPRNWTAFGDDGKPISDSARYRMLGNAVCVSTAEWIARRVMEVLRGER